MEELNIGYAIIVRALSVGLEQAVSQMRACLDVCAHDAPCPA